MQIAITGASTTTGVAGEQVTFTGPNVGDCNPVVTFNGVPAAVVSSTTNSVTVTIPTGATSGPVTITNCHGTATSTFTFTIGAVVVTPPLVIVNPGISVQFSASVLPAGSSQAVTWSVDGIVGGDASVGTITASGLYSVPVGASGVIIIQATSVANPLLSGAATVRIVDTVNFDEAFSPGVSVLLNGANFGAALPVYVQSPGVSVLQNTVNLGANVPVFVASPGLSVLSSKMTGTGGTIAYYVASPGVSVRLGLASGGTDQTAVYLISPPVSVQFGAVAAGKATPVSVFSPGVSVTNLTPTAGDEGTVFILSPGVSVVPSAKAGRAFPPGPVTGPIISGVQPSALRRGTELVTVAGANLDAAKAVGFLDDAGHLDKNITVRGVTVSPGGHVLTLRLSVGPWTVPGRRRLVLWSLP